jgi:ribosome-associated protein
MNLEKQIKTVVDAIGELKGEDIVTLNVMAQSVDMEAIIIATGRSVQHVRGIVNNIKIEAKKLNMTLLGIEGEEFGEWALIDLGEVVAHIMIDKTRNFYKLEKLWSIEDDEN